jgi:choline dehydrogenase-like flavoprotein
VGSGPAGIGVVDRLRSSGLSIFLIESGGFEPELRTQRLYRGENIGRPYFSLDSCRFRLFGGSSNRWGGWCRPLDPVDFQQREGSSWKGWPIDSSDLDRFNAPAAELLQLPHDRFEASCWAGQLPPPLPLDGNEFESVLIQYSPPTNFGSRYRERILRDGHVTTLLHANATEMVLDQGGYRLDAVRIKTLSGRSFTVRSRAVVLAAGGIENARLLLTSNSSRPAGLGNEHDVVGRCFMEHIHVPAGHLQLYEHDIRPRFYGPVTVDGGKIRGFIAPTALARRRHGLLGCSFTVEPASFGSYGTPFLGWPANITIPAARAYLELRHRAPALAEELKWRVDRSWNTGLKLHTGLAERRARAEASVGAVAMPNRLLSLYARGEQAANPMSRVSLSRHRDALGMQRTRLDWRLAKSDIASVSSWVSRLDHTLRSNSLGRVILPPEGWDASIVGGPHHMGTTRMSASPEHGVVDANCRVHSVANLYVAGSSVFATGGWTHPTFTIVALALRLADHLREVLTGAGHQAAEPVAGEPAEQSVDVRAAETRSSDHNLGQ